MGQFRADGVSYDLNLDTVVPDAKANPPTGWVWVNAAASDGSDIGVTAAGEWMMSHGVENTQIDNDSFAGPCAHLRVQTGSIGPGGFRATARLKGVLSVAGATFNHVLFMISRDIDAPLGTNLAYVGLFNSLGGAGGLEIGFRHGATINPQVASSAPEQAAGVWFEYRSSANLDAVSLWYSVANQATRPDTGWTVLANLSATTFFQSATAFRLWFGLATDGDVTGTLDGRMSGFQLRGARV